MKLSNQKSGQYIKHCLYASTRYRNSELMTFSELLPVFAEKMHSLSCPHCMNDRRVKSIMPRDPAMRKRRSALSREQCFSDLQITAIS